MTSHNDYPIPFNRSAVIGKELDYITEALKIGQIAGDQSFTQRCQELLEKALQVPKALLTTSGTHALELAALLLDLQPGDQVIVPSFTFVSTVNAFVLRGARPVFVDIRQDTLNMDEAQVERLLTSRTKAIVPVHYAGVGCEMDVIMEVASRHGIAVLEDNAHGLFGSYRGRKLGTFGDFSAQSFHETKNFTCGEGGALLLNDARYIERAEILRQKGTDRSRFFRGQVDKYTWVDIGSSYVMSDVLAAFLYGQLEVWQQIQHKRRRVWEYYDRHLGDWARERGIRRPVVPPHCDQAYHMYYLVLPSQEQRAALIEHLKKRGILSVFHYLPLHLSVMGQKFGGKPGACPVTEDVSGRLLRLPFYNTLSEFLQEKVVAALFEF
ncbi:MAG: dTDP-4-amino-4,6-dideoxygalactose transaminase [Terriglobia bacterium]|jgi:dTDP-4-amino-4,6-dideoxygalactose transaminase